MEHQRHLASWEDGVEGTGGRGYHMAVATTREPEGREGSESYEIVSGPGGVRAVCSRGWRTALVSSAGVAGSAWDTHRVEAHAVRGG